MYKTNCLYIVLLFIKMNFGNITSTTKSDNSKCNKAYINTTIKCHFNSFNKTDSESCNYLINQEATL